MSQFTCVVSDSVANCEWSVRRQCLPRTAMNSYMVHAKALRTLRENFATARESLRDGSQKELCCIAHKIRASSPSNLARQSCRANGINCGVAKSYVAREALAVLGHHRQHLKQQKNTKMLRNSRIFRNV